MGVGSGARRLQYVHRYGSNHEQLQAITCWDLRQDLGIYLRTIEEIYQPRAVLKEISLNIDVDVSMPMSIMHVIVTTVLVDPLTNQINK